MNQERGASISVRLASKSARGHGGQTAHDLRTSAELEYVDYSRSPRNSILIPPAPGYELREICEQRRSQRETKRSMKSNAHVAFEGIITFSKLAQPIIESLPLNEQDDIFQQVAERIAKHLNTTLHGLVVHRDESAIHAHFTLAGYDLSGNPLTQTVKRQQCIQIQDIAGEVVQHLGISRGKSKVERIKDGEPLNAYINRTVKQLHEDLPKEKSLLEQQNEQLQLQIEQLQTQIEQEQKNLQELQEKERKNAERLEKTLQKLQEAEEANDKLQKRAETYQNRLEKTQKELEETQARLEKMNHTLETLQQQREKQQETIQNQTETIKKKQEEIKRLRKIIEPQKPEPVQIEQFKGWKETGNWPLKRKEPILEPVKVISLKAAEKSLLATRKAAEEEAKRKAKQAVQDELNRYRARIKQLEREKEEIELQLEAETTYRDLLVQAIESASKASWLSTCVNSEFHQELPHDKDNPPEIIHYNATLLDYGTKLVAVGDGTPPQQAAALYKASRERGWEKTIFSGMNEEQIEWLVEAAEKDEYDIDFEENWAREHAEKIRQELKQKQPESHISRTPGM